MTMKLLLPALLLAAAPLHAQTSDPRPATAADRDLAPASAEQQAAVLQRKSSALTLKLAARRPASPAAVLQRKTQALERKLNERARDN